MAKKSTKAKSETSKVPVNQLDTISSADEYIYYDRLNFIPPEQKDSVWAAKSLVYVKFHSQPFVEPGTYERVNKEMNGYIDEDKMKKRIDPEEGKAEYFNKDFKECPLHQHLDEILDASIKQIPVNIGVKAVDEFSISNKQQNNRKLQSRNLVRNIINQVNDMMGYPLLKKTDDPFLYIQRIKQAAAAQQAAQNPAGPQVKPISAVNQQISPRKKQMPTDLMDSLIAQIDSDELLGVYNEYLHKEGVEIACELGIDYYVNVKNKFVYRHTPKITRDIKGHNRACMRLYTSQTTGTPVIDYLRPDVLNISPYIERDLSDHMHWFYETDITFDQFIRQCGAELSTDDLRDIFELNRKWNGMNTSFDQTGIIARNNALIRVGYVEWLSQDMEVYSDYTTAEGNAAYKKMRSDFMPGYRKDKQSSKMVKDPNISNSAREESHFNVWYKCYYIPYYFNSDRMATLDFEKQAKYIYDFGKLQDQERYGDDEIFSRSSLIGASSDRKTWFEIKKEFKDEIDFLWVHFKNDLSNISPAGVNWIYDMILQMTPGVDDANENNKNAIDDWAMKVKQTGTAITKILRDPSGAPIPGIDPFKPLINPILEEALKKLNAILMLYDMMLKALGQNAISEGDAPKPRTNLGSIQLSLGATGKSTYYIEEMYTDMICSMGNKMIKYFKDIIEYGDSDRLSELCDIIGQANYAALNEIKGIPARTLGIYVENTMTKDQKDMIMQIAQSMASAGTLDEATALFLMFVDNLRQAYAILVFKKDQMDKKLAAQQQQQQQFQMALADKQLQIKLAEISANGQVKERLETIILQMQEHIQTELVNLKGHWQQQTKDQINQNRMEESITTSQIDKMNNTGMPPGRVNSPPVVA